ncbi:hypothetical protein [Paraburkholderia hospita]|uniref:hypothetical protein n=1 Tax=Paraburkholderia hospita TaxID=169430 RepID=UPI00103D12E2|nr:hypothetical protein [Paraburkholderia hospita]
MDDTNATLNVQFSDSTETTITSYFGCPQDALAWPNQGTVDPADARWKTYYESLPTLIKAALPTPS